MVCFDHDDDSSKNIEKNDDCLECTLIIPAASNNLEETPATETECALTALCVPRDNSNIPESSTKLASNSESQLGPTTTSVVTPAKEKRRKKMSQTAEKKTSKKRPPTHISRAQQAIQMGKTFKNVAAEIVRMAGLDRKEKELAVDAEIQKELDAIKFTGENSENVNKNNLQTC